MAIFIKGTAELARTTELKIESFESNGAAEWEDTLTIKTGYYAKDDDVVICLTRNHRVIGESSERENVWDAEIDISKEQAISLAHYLLSHLR